MFYTLVEYKGKKLYDRTYVLSPKSKSDNLLSRIAALKLQIIVFMGSIEVEKSLLALAGGRLSQ